jgi:hypothetical protein
MLRKEILKWRKKKNLTLRTGLGIFKNYLEKNLK